MAIPHTFCASVPRTMQLSRPPHPGNGAQLLQMLQPSHVTGGPGPWLNCRTNWRKGAKSSWAHLEVHNCLAWIPGR